MEKDTHLELNNEHKTCLLNLGLSSNSVEYEDDPEEARRDCLYNTLISPLPIPRTTASTIPTLLQGLSQKLVAIAGKPLGELLQDGSTSLSTFKQIKDYAKQMGQHAGTDVAKDVYMVVYFAAIAGALVRHRTKISQHTDQDLQRFLQTYQNIPWMLPELKWLFEKAPEAEA